MVESTELVIKICWSFGCHEHPVNSATCPLCASVKIAPRNTQRQVIRSVLHVSDVHVALDKGRPWVVRHT